MFVGALSVSRPTLTTCPTVTDPQHITIRKEGEETIVRYRPKMPDQWVYALFLLLFGSVLTAAGIAHGNFLALGLSLIGLFLLYSWVAILVSKWKFRVGRTTIRRRFGPLPVFRREKADFPVRDFVQLYVRKRLAGKKQRAVFSLYARDSEGKDHLLVGEEASFRALAELEIALETILDIRNDPSLDLSDQGFTLNELTQRLQTAKDYRAWLNATHWIPQFWKDVADEKILTARLALERYQDKRAGGHGSSAELPGPTRTERAPLPAPEYLRVTPKPRYLQLQFRHRDRNYQGATWKSYLMLYLGILAAFSAVKFFAEELAGVLLAGCIFAYFFYLYRTRRRTVRLQLYRHKFSIATGYFSLSEGYFFSTEDIVQFYVRRQPEGKNGNISFALFVQQRSGPDRVLLDGVEEPGYLLELEDHLEYELKIVNQPELGISDTGQTLAEMEQVLELYERQYASAEARSWSSELTLRNARRKAEDARRALERYRDKLG